MQQLRDNLKFLSSVVEILPSSAILAAYLSPVLIWHYNSTDLTNKAQVIFRDRGQSYNLFPDYRLALCVKVNYFWYKQRIVPNLFPD